MDIRTVSQVLYHGSVRLYSIQCYINRTRSLLISYLSDINNHRLQTTVPQDQHYKQWRAFVKQTLKNYTTQLPSSQSTYLSWTTQVIFLEAVEMMYLLLPEPLLISNVLIELIGELIDGEGDPSDIYGIYKVFQEDYERMVEMTESIEALRSIEEVDATGFLTVDYFTVMRQPIQFFGDLNTSLLYGLGLDHTYVYTPDRELRLMNISDVNTIEFLLKEGNPFSSFEAYNEEDLKYYVQVPLYHYRSVNITHIIMVYWQRAKRHREAASVEYRRRIDTVVASLDPSSGGNDMVAKLDLLLDEIAAEAPVIYNELLERYVTITTPPERLLAELVKVFGGRRAGADYVASKLQQYASLRIGKLHQEMRKENGSWLTDMINDFDDELICSPKLVDRYLDWLDTVATEDLETVKFFFGELLQTSYFEFFNYDIASPRGDWLLSQWEVLHRLPGSTRFSNYASDTMLISALLSTDFLPRYGLDGWICYNPPEIMLLRPEDKGVMKKLNEHYNTNTCIFSGKESRDNFLKEYA